MANYVKIPISSLMADPENVRVHDEKNLRAIEGSLKTFGQQKPIVVDKNYRVLAGNGTLTAARRLGWTELDCVISTLTGDEAMAYALADNRTAELADWDMSHLGHQLQSLSDLGFDIAEIGFEPDWDKDVKDREPKDKGDNEAKKEFLVVVECSDERSQEALYHDLLEKGYQVRLV